MTVPLAPASKSLFENDVATVLAQGRKAKTKESNKQGGVCMNAEFEELSVQSIEIVGSEKSDEACLSTGWCRRRCQCRRNAWLCGFLW